MTDNRKFFFAVNLAVQTENQEDFLKSVESLSRTAAGLAMDGLTASMTCMKIESEEG